MKNLVIKLLPIFLLVVSGCAHAEVVVSPLIASAPISKSWLVKPGAYQVIELPGGGTVNDAYRVTVTINNAVYKDISAFIVDQNNLQLFQQGYAINGIGYQKAQAPFTVQGSTHTPGAHFLILDNRYAAVITKQVGVVIEAKYELSAEDQRHIKDSFEKMYAGIKEQFVFPDFNVYIKPCGQINAYSNTNTGDINYCSEMISDLANKNNSGALMGIFLHEVGHSLLGLWGIPGNNNEDIADEFATYTMMTSGPNGYAMLYGFLDYWKDQDSVGEANIILTRGDRHSLSIQRIRNIRENLNSGEAFVQRWNRLVYQHFTVEALQRIVDHPRPGDNPELAKATLNQMLASKQ